MPVPRLHHYCQNIVPGFLSDIVEMYALLDFVVVYAPPEPAGWLMVGQKDLRFAIQIAEVNRKPETDLETKRQSHIAFIADEPQQIINRIHAWADGKGLRFREGGWSDRERYFDLPDVFVNFVVEVMHTSIEKE